jgi:pseudouridine-5'-phosphate glycosidase
MGRALHDRLLADGLAKIAAEHVRGKDVTPVLLDHFHTGSDGASLSTNEELVVANAELAADVAVALTAWPRT